MPDDVSRHAAPYIFSRTHALEQMRRGAFGRRLRLADLPAPGARWTPACKAMLIAAIEEGMITLEEACRRYALSAEEFRCWQDAIEVHGVPGLRATRTQIYRITEGR